VLVTNDETQRGLWATYTWSGSTWTATSLQAYYTPFYWSKVDWYNSTYDSTVLPTYTVNTYSDIAGLSASVGDTIKVLNNGNGEFAIYQVGTTGSLDLVGIQNGTIQFNDSLYTTNAASVEIRAILLSYAIFIPNTEVSLNDFFFIVINYIFSEQPSVDWIFKTSFVTVLHKLRKLNQPANYIPDNQTYYESYINEVKPYRTSIREYKIDYQGDDAYSGDLTDFDIPSTYISSLGVYRSPDGSLDSDATNLSTLPQYNQWYNNYGYGIIDVLVANPGANYTLTPTVTVSGGGGSGANVIAIMDFASNSISRFEVINPGQGYTSTPLISINGTGTGAIGSAILKNHYLVESLPTTVVKANASVTVYAGNIITQPNTGAYGTVYSASTGNLITLVDVVGTFANYQYLYSDLSNLGVTTSNSVTSYTQFINQSYNTVRNITTTIKFDRTSYTSNIVTWQPNVTISANSWVSYNNQAYQATSNVYSTAILSLSSNVTAAVGNYITQANATGNARVLAVSSNLQLITLGNITGTYQRRGGNISVNGVATGARPVNINNVFDYTKYTPLNSNVFTSATDRIVSYYQPDTGMPGKDLSQLVSGIAYPGVTITGVNFGANTQVTNSNVVYAWSNIGTLFSSNITKLDFTTLGYSVGQPLTMVNQDTAARYKLTIASITPSQLVASGITSGFNTGANISLSYYDYNNATYLDTSIQDFYTNTNFGSNVGDIGVDGGAYIDTYSSHAPEELVPGTLYDSLNMTVSTKLQNNTAVMSYRIVHNMGANASSTNTALWPIYYGIDTAHTTTLSANLNLTDSVIYVTNASKLTSPSPNLGYPGVIYINGEKIIYWTIDTVNNTLGQIRRAVDGTGAAVVHTVGSSVVEAGISEIIPGGNIVHTTHWLNLPINGANVIVDNYGVSLADNTGNLLLTASSNVGAVTDGLGLENSLTEQAIFIKNLKINI
jgi:hypothetical protein